MENTDDPQEKKEELLNTIENVKKQVTEYIESGRKIVEDGQHTSDIADRTKDIILGTPANSIVEADEQTKILRRVERQILDANSVLSPLITSGPIFGTAMTSATSFTVRGALDAAAVYHDEGHIFSVQRLNNVLEKRNWPDQAKDEMHRLGLDAPPSGQRSALDLLQEAHQAFLKPPSGDVTPEGVLLTAREAMLATIDQLLKQRPHATHDITSGTVEKICSIGTHCGRAGIQQSQFNNLGLDAKNILHNQLSSAKGKALSREDVQNRFYAACNFLKTFLSMIDETKLRK
jgi:hypothetical protein